MLFAHSFGCVVERVLPNGFNDVSSSGDANDLMNFECKRALLTIQIPSIFFWLWFTVIVINLLAFRNGIEEEKTSCGLDHKKMSYKRSRSMSWVSVDIKLCIYSMGISFFLIGQPSTLTVVNLESSRIANRTICIRLCDENFMQFFFMCKHSVPCTTMKHIEYVLSAITQI